MVLSRDKHENVHSQQVLASMGMTNNANNSANHSQSFHV